MVHDLSPLDSEAHHWLPLPFRLRFRASLALSTRVATSVLAPSQFTARRLVETYGLDPSHVGVAANAIDGELGALLHSGRRVTPEIPTVLSVGNVLPRKNLTTVAAAVRRLQRQGIPIRYRIAGQVGPGGAPVVRELRRILPDVEITGYISTAQLAEQYLSASVLAFPSLYEGFGIPMIEAMRAGLPVISSDSTSLPEIAGGASMVAPARDDDAWRAAIALLITDDGARRRLIHRGTARARQFDWGSTAHVVAGALLSAGADRRRVARRWRRRWR
jgi:glycosyltransferase involved in cell wall biosynthesis